MIKSYDFDLQYRAVLDYWFQVACNLAHPSASSPVELEKILNRIKDDDLFVRKMGVYFTKGEHLFVFNIFKYLI